MEGSKQARESSDECEAAPSRGGRDRGKMLGGMLSKSFSRVNFKEVMLVRVLDWSWSFGLYSQPEDDGSSNTPCAPGKNVHAFHKVRVCIPFNLH